MKRNKLLFNLAVLTILTAGIISTAEPALKVPALRSRVNDYANILSPGAISSIENKLSLLEKSDSTQVVVLTIPSLEGDALEDFSIRVAEAWKIGQKGLDNGAILLISRDDHKVRIEVGYGLEGKLTDLMAGRIIDDIIIPSFRKGNFDGGIEEAVDAIASVVRGEFTAKDLPDKKEKPFSGKYIFFIIFFFFLMNSLGRVSKVFSGIIGAIILPIIGLFFFPLALWLFLLIPAGFFLGLILPLFFIGSGRGHGGGFFGGTGGFGGGGFSSGGFSGGGGGFGGGGASGSW